MFSFATYQRIWKSLREFPWPTITLLSMMLSAASLLWLRGEYESHIIDLKDRDERYIHEVRDHAKDQVEGYRQTNSALERLADYLQHRIVNDTTYTP